MNCKVKINTAVLLSLYISNKIENVQLVVSILMIAGAAAGSIFPDLDYKDMLKGRRVRIQEKITKNTIRIHAPLIYLLIYSILYAVVSDDIWKIILQGFFIGIFTHIILEGFSHKGIPWFYPMNANLHSLIRKSGKRKEEIAISSVLLVINILVLLDMMKITSIFRFTQ